MQEQGRCTPMFEVLAIHRRDDQQMSHLHGMRCDRAIGERAGNLEKQVAQASESSRSGSSAS